MASLNGFLWRCVVNGVAASVFVPDRVRQLLYRAMGVGVPLHARISPGVTLKTRRLAIGYRTTINNGCLFDNRAMVTVGDRVGIGYGVRLITSTHEFSDPECRAGT